MLTLSSSNEDLMTTMKELMLTDFESDPYKLITPKTKSAFTREYNNSSHTSQGLFMGDDAIDAMVKQAKESKKAAKGAEKAAKTKKKIDAAEEAASGGVGAAAGKKRGKSGKK